MGMEQCVLFVQIKDIDSLYEELSYRVQARGFDYLALCSAEGELQMIYGEQMRLVDPEPRRANIPTLIIKSPIKLPTKKWVVFVYTVNRCGL